MSANRWRRSSRTVDMAALTVVVPVWDRYVRRLDECVESILAQRAECDLRVLVLDNASTRPLPEQSPDVAMVRTPERLSVGAARNHALGNVDTPLVAFADVDDLFPAGYFAFAVQRLLARDELVAVGLRREPSIVTSGKVFRADTLRRPSHAVVEARRRA